MCFILGLLASTHYILDYFKIRATTEQYQARASRSTGVLKRHATEENTVDSTQIATLSRSLNPWSCASRIHQSRKGACIICNVDQLITTERRLAIDKLPRYQ